MLTAIDFIIAITLIIIFINILPYLKANIQDPDPSPHPSPHRHKPKPIMRGVVHILSSLIFPIIYWFMGSDNISMESMILCCTASSMYHRLTPFIPERYISTFRLMDYMGIDCMILSYSMMLMQKVSDTYWLDKMPLFIIMFLIMEFLQFHYHYHIHPMEQLNQMITHALCLGFTLIHVIRYQEYMNPWFLLMVLTYFISFYIFTSIGPESSDSSEHWFWSQHETFHLILLIAFIVHLIISIN